MKKRGLYPKPGAFYTILTFIMVMLAMHPVAGQKKERRVGPVATIQAIARAYKDSIVVRWAPTTAVAWKLANQAGYVLERYTIGRNGRLDTLQRPERLLLTAGGIRPLPLNAWESLVRQNKYAAIAAQALYGSSFKLSTPTDKRMAFSDQATELENRHSFALFAADHSAAVAEGMALRYVDRKVRKGEQYVYKVYLGPSKTIYPVDTGYVVIRPEEVIKLPKPLEVKGEFKDRAVLLSWNAYYHSTFYTSYTVERSDDGGKTFKATDEMPFISPGASTKPDQRVVKLDSLPENGKLYLFRLKGNTPFGETGPASEPVQGSGQQALGYQIPVITQSIVQPDGQVQLTWRFPGEEEAKVKGFAVSRASKSNGTYTPLTSVLLPATNRSFTDSSPFNDGYYLVIVEGKDSTTRTSFPYYVQREDSLPPTAPVGLAGNATHKGMVDIQWTPNREPDLMGYRVFRANSLQEQFVQVTKESITTPYFRDTITVQTLTKHVYYKIVALDTRYNPSDYSEALTLKRPDVVAPVNPAFEGFNTSDSLIQLQWTASVSEDVVLHELYRSRLPDGESLFIKAFKVEEETLYADTTVQPGQAYAYRLYAVDETGLRSKGVSLTVSTVDRGLRTPIGNITKAVDREKKQVQLTWEYGAKNVARYLIYRAPQGMPLRLYKSVKGDTKVFTDTYLTVNTTYTYRVKATYPDGGESPLSTEITIAY